MNREVHVRLREGVGVKFPRATRPPNAYDWSASVNLTTLMYAPHLLGKLIEWKPKPYNGNFLFRNANIVLDGHAELQPSYNVLVAGEHIETVTREPIQADNATIIDVAGKTVMPGLIDAHAHITGLTLSPKNLASPTADIVLAASTYLRNCLMAGFTTIREAGGADYTIAHLLRNGEILGPRMFYSGKALTQTGGGADFRTPVELTDPCGHVSPLSVMSVIADGVDKVREAAREELRKGASQLKVFASGGVVFPAEGHATRYEFSEAELHAIVEEAAARDTYVMAHVYSDEGVRRCLKAGVRSIEHGNFMNEETTARIAEKGAFLDPTFISLIQRVESAHETNLSSKIVDNLKRTIERGKQVYMWATAAPGANCARHGPVGARCSTIAIS